MRVADAIADWLVAHSITHAYGIIGGGNHVLFDAISKAKKTQIICCHHEQAAAMASCYHNRLTRGLGSIALCTTGAGSTNTITGVMAAYMDSTPLLILSGNEHSKYMDSQDRVWGVQGYGSCELVEQCSVYAARYDGMFPVSNYLDAALQAAVFEHGPAWLDIPKNLQSADA